jgi:hypothetical protein
MHKIPWGTSKMYTIPWGTLKYVQSYEELPKMYKAYLEVSHGILCIFGSSSWQSIHMSIHPFTFSLQNTCFNNMHTDWLRLSLAATSSKCHPVITHIRVTRPRLMRCSYISIYECLKKMFIMSSR